MVMLGFLCSADSDPAVNISNNSNGSLPNVSECVQYTVLVWLPALFFWLLFPLFLVQGECANAMYAQLEILVIFQPKG